MVPFQGTSIVPESNGGTAHSPESLTAFGNEVFFSATRSDGQREVFHTSVGDAEFTIAGDLAGTNSSEPEQLRRPAATNLPNRYS
ncbi:MAG: hypothetical protein AAFN70_03855 [Planctomycetota bacterium]